MSVLRILKIGILIKAAELKGSRESEIEPKY
jgi:hypothetical protein